MGGNKTGRKKRVEDRKTEPKSISDLKKHVDMTKDVDEASKEGFDRCRRLTNNIAGPRFLVMRRKETGKTLTKFNPFSMMRLIRGAAKAELEQVKLLRDGTLLIQTKDRESAANLVQLIKIPPGVDVIVDEHERLNNTKGVIYEKSLVSMSNEAICAELSKQVVKTPS